MRVLRTLCTIAGGSVFGVMNGPVAPVAQAQSTHAVLPVSVVQQPTPTVRTVSLDVKDSTLKYVLDALTSQARLRPVYRNTAQLTRRITLKVRNVNVMDAIATALQGTGMVARMAPDGSTVMIRSTQDTTVPADRQNSGKIQGEVKDSSNGKPLTGVAISVKGFRLATVSDVSGAFTLTGLPAGEHTVQLRYLGYASTTRLISVTEEKTAVLRVLLRPTASMLSGVVTTATGEQRKLEVGNSITTLNVDSIMQIAPITSVTDLLEARVPGLTVQRTSGSPGDPARIRLRGASSIYQNNDPIIVVDGIRVYSQQSDARNTNIDSRSTTSGYTGYSTSYATPSPLDQIDPNTIETIEVLKGPSAAALYGSDAANGVIIINTKRGQAGPARWNVALNHGVSSIPGKWPEGFWAWGTGSGGGGPQLCLGLCAKDGVVDSLIRFQALNNPRYTALSTGYDQGASITASGGSQTLQYALTASGGAEQGLLKLPAIEAERYYERFEKAAPGWMRRPEQLRRWSASGQMTSQLKNNMNVSVTSMLSKQSQHRTSMSSSYQTAISELQVRFIDVSQELQGPLLGNPYERVTSDMLTLTNAAQLRYQPVAWLPINGTVGVSVQNRDDEKLLGRSMLLTYPDSVGFFTGKHNTVINHTASLFTTARLRERLSLAAGLNYTRQGISDQAGSFRNIPIGVTNPSAGDSSGTMFQRATAEQQTFGWFLEPKLNVSSRFFVVPGFRLDNNGLSGKNAKLLGLPKLNFSWVASDERLFPFKDVIRLFRVRTAFGTAGVQPNIQDGTRLFTREQLGSEVTGGSSAYGNALTLSYLGNTKLRPERGHEIEGGIDAELWNGRFSTAITHYRKKRIDAIIGDPTASSVGGGSIRINLGDILNSGTELAVTAQLLERRSIGWNVNVAMSRNQSKVQRLGQETDFYVQQTFSGSALRTYYVVGYPMNGIWANPIYGYADLDGNGFITAGEVSTGGVVNSRNILVYMGASDPDYQLNMQSGLTLFGGRLGVNVGMSYVSGMTQSEISCFGNSASDTSSKACPFLLAMNAPNTAPGYQAAVIMARAGETNYGMIRTTSTFRFQSLSINTNLGPRIARYFASRTVGIALQGSNLGLWTNYQGKDPNVNAFTTGQGTADTGQLPQPRKWILRITLGN